MATIQTRDTRSFVANHKDLYKKQFHVMQYSEVSTFSTDVQFFEVEGHEFSAAFRGSAKLKISDKNTKLTITGTSATNNTASTPKFKLRLHVPHRFDEIIEITPTPNKGDNAEAMADVLIAAINAGTTEFHKDKSNLDPFKGESLAMSLDVSKKAAGELTASAAHKNGKLLGQRGVLLATAPTQAPAGILINTPARKDASATVAVSGICPAVCANVSNISLGTPLMVDGNGKVVAFARDVDDATPEKEPTAAAKSLYFSIGRALETPTVADQIISIEIDIQTMSNIDDA